MPRKGSKEALELQVEKLKRELAEARQENRPPPQAVLDLGPTPQDTLGMQLHGMRVLAIQLDEVKTDESLTPKERRAESRAITDSMVKLVPNSRKYEAEQIIKGDRAELERKKPRGAKLVEVPDAVAGPGEKPKKPRRKKRPRKESKAPAGRRDAGPKLVPAPKP